MKRFRIGVCVGSLVLLGALFTQVAGAGSTWLQLPANLFGFGGDFVDISVLTFDAQNRDSVVARRTSPLAAPKTYRVPDRSGVTRSVTIRSDEKANLGSIFSVDLFLIYTSEAHIDDLRAAGIDPDAYSRKSWAIFLAAQAGIQCSNTTEFSPAVSGGGTSKLTGTAGTYDAKIEVVLCSDGSFPVNGQDWFAHGIRRGQ